MNKFLDKFRPVLFVIGILFLAFGGFIIISNFYPYVFMYPKDLVNRHYLIGCTGAISIILGLGIFSWLWKDLFSWRKSKNKRNDWHL
jgi:hypothetical protein